MTARINKHILSFDVEDWFQGFITRGINGWQKFGSREKNNIELILNLLEKHNSKATFFILGNFAKSNEDVVKLIDSAGHEIASHGFGHIPLQKHSKESFREDLLKSKDILEQITGKRVIGHRAASFSLNEHTVWSLEILVEEGFLYDSSLFPSNFHPYGNAKYFEYQHEITMSSGEKIVEYPAQVLKIGFMKIPAAGGFYFRALPFFLSRMALKQSERVSMPGMVYMHPYDFDVETPKLKVGATFNIIRYYNLKKTKLRLERLLAAYNFVSVQNLVEERKIG